MLAGVGSEEANKRDKSSKKRQQQQEASEKQKKRVKLERRVVVSREAVGASEARGKRVPRLPFPFKSLPDFEAGLLSQPIGRSFVPESAFRVLTRERVSCRRGTIVPPLSLDNLKPRASKRQQ